MSEVDPLQPETGQFQREPIERWIDEIIAQIKLENAGHVSVVYLDIDGYTHIEEEYGYRVADVLLNRIADELRKIEKADMAGRYVRDSFLIIYNDLTMESAFLEAEQWRKQLSEMTFELNVEGQEYVIRTTFSAGVATFPGDPTDRYELISLAEDAAGQAYEAGGSRTTFGRSVNMTPKTSHYTPAQLDRLRTLRNRLGRSEASLLREALDDLLRKYDQRDLRRGLKQRVMDWVATSSRNNDAA